MRKMAMKKQFPCENSEGRGLDTGRIAESTNTAGLAHPALPDTPNARHLRPSDGCKNYINMVLRISPTASPSISNASPGWTTMTG